MWLVRSQYAGELGAAFSNHQNQPSAGTGPDARRSPAVQHVSRWTHDLDVPGMRVPAAGLWRGAPPALLSGQNRIVVGAAGSEAAWTALTVGDFDAVYQRVAVFDLLGMVAATERARGHLSPVELHVPNGTRRSEHSGGLR
jgi:hypothetical protein